MSALGKIVTIGVIGVVSYYTFVEKRNPLAKFWSNPVETANKDYVEHKAKGEEAIAGKKATILEAEGTKRDMTR